MDISNHEFGGVSTDLKLEMVEAYLSGFTTALRGKFGELWYIDAFAGTGERTVRLEAEAATLFDDETPERIERIRGSAKRAVETKPAFNRLIFIDSKTQHCNALQMLAMESASPSRRIDVLQGDANLLINQLIANEAWAGKRAVMFLDPYGMSVDWETLKSIRSTEAVDVWYFVSLSGLFRQAARNGSAVDEKKRQALTRMLGTDEWEKEWYKQSDSDLFGSTETFRQADVKAIEKYVWRRLQTLFPKVLKPRTFYNDKKVPMFALFFAISNPEGKAIGLASKIASHILNSGSSSQVRPR